MKMEHKYESNIKCPYCDWEDQDSWEFGEDSGTHTCGSCGRVNERDFLASNNIKKFALKDYSGQELPVEPVEMSALAESMKQEAQPTP